MNNDALIDIEWSENGGETWHHLTVKASSMIAHALTKGGRTTIHQIERSYRLPKGIHAQAGTR
jgi:hypothetical protein